MDVYQIWCDLKPGISDLAFAEGLGRWLSLLQREGRIASWRLLRRKPARKMRHNNSAG